MNDFDRDVKEFHYLFRLLLAVDQVLNVMLWNGSHNETISGNIGRQIKKGEANKVSRGVCYVLRKIHNKHCIKSIGE